MDFKHNNLICGVVVLHNSILIIYLIEQEEDFDNIIIFLKLR